MGILADLMWTTLWVMSSRTSSTLGILKTTAMLPARTLPRRAPRTAWIQARSVSNTRQPRSTNFARTVSLWSAALEQAPPPEVAPSVYESPRGFVPFPFDYHEILTVEIESLTNRGWGLARVEITKERGESVQKSSIPAKQGRKRKKPNVNTEFEEYVDRVHKETGDLKTAPDSEQNYATAKWVIMVPNVIPGEVVSVRIYRNFRNYSEADVVTIETAHAHRIAPTCPLSGVCGGCQLQHMSVEWQRSWKTKWVAQGLQQFGFQFPDGSEPPSDSSTGTLPVVLPTLGTHHVFGYRSKLTPHYQARQSQIGFQQQTSRQIVDVPSCPIATPAVNQAYQRKRTELQKQSLDSNEMQQLHDDDVEDLGVNSPATTTRRKREKGATLLFRQGNIDNETVVTDPNQYISTTVRGITFRYLAGNFFQNNYYVLELMVQHVRDAVLRQSDDGGVISHVVDCYCGSGLFALSVAGVVSQVAGIEINARAIQEATDNAAANDIVNCQFVAASAERIFYSDLVQNFPRDATTVIVDPPRAGCSAEFLEQLIQYRPRRIIYMSCDPITQARDAALLCDVNSSRSFLGSTLADCPTHTTQTESKESTVLYQVVSIQPFDLFPQTRHVENLMIFDRLDASK
jgi:tRNA (uracil-5-)-methyltransferase